MWGLQSLAVALAVALGQANPHTTLQGGLEALKCPFFMRWGRRTGCRCQLILLFFPLAICSLVLFRLFLLILLLLFTLPFPYLLLLPQLALSLLLLPLFFGCPLWLGSLRIRHLLDF